MTSLVGNIVERKPGQTSSSSLSSQRINGDSSTGFPVAQHRSKSAFSRSRNQAKQTNDKDRPQQPPIVSISTAVGPESSSHGHEVTDWRRQVEEDNVRRVASMTEEEREEERNEIMQKFGPGIGDILKKARAAREGKDQEQEFRPMEGVPLSPKSPRKDLKAIKSMLLIFFT